MKLTLKQLVHDYVKEQCPEAVYEPDDLSIIYGYKRLMNAKVWPNTYRSGDENDVWSNRIWGLDGYFVSMHNFTVEILRNSDLGIALHVYLETTKNWDADDEIEINHWIDV